MLLIMIEDQLLSPEPVCTTCLLADQEGQPRWYQGRLRCGQAIGQRCGQRADQYECQMGFRLVQVD